MELFIVAIAMILFASFIHWTKINPIKEDDEVMERYIELMRRRSRRMRA